MFKKIFLMVLSLLVLSTVYSAGISISPGIIELDDVLKGGYAETTALIGNPNAVPIKINFQSNGEAARWIGFDPNKNVVLEPKEQLRIKIFVNVPEGTPNGVYQVIAVAAAEPSAGSKGTGAAVSAAVGVIINIHVIGDEIKDITVDKVTTGKLETGYPLDFNFVLKNTGNVVASAKYEFNLWNENNSTKIGRYVFNGIDIAPFETIEESFTLPVSNLTSGYYWVNVRTFLLDKLVYDEWKKLEIQPPGTYSVGGILEEIKFKGNLNAEELTEIVGVLNNTGQVPLTAKLRIELYQYDITVEKLVDVIYGEERRIENGEVGELNAYYNFKNEGNYRIKSKAMYFGKESNEIITEFKVTPGNIFVEDNVLVSLLVVLVIVLSALMVIVILKKKIKRKKLI